MVYTNRTEKYISSQETPAGKGASSGSMYQSSFGSHSSSASSNSSKQTNNAWSKNASEADKWKYNSMVRDERNKFNSMHFC